jgi:hypothetical protein
MQWCVFTIFGSYLIQKYNYSFIGVKDTSLTLRREERMREFRKQKKIFEVSVFVGPVSASPGGRNPTVR